jgi:hypothetical protein
MGVTYLIAAHHQPELFGRLADRVGRSGHVIAHIDGKSDEQPFRDVAPHATFTRDRARVHWGGFSNVQMMLNLLREGLEASPASSHFIHLSGSDYPVRPAEDLESLLATDPSRSYCNFYRVVQGSKFYELTRSFDLTDQLSRVPAPLRPALARVVRRVAPRFLDSEFPPGLPPFRGSTSSCLSRAAVEYVLEFVSTAEGRRLMRRLRSVLVSDEFVIQTILCNSPLRSSLAGWPDDDASGIPTDNEKEVYLHYIDWDPDREDPALLTMEDLPRIRASGMYFARKMDGKRSAGLMDALDRDGGFTP